MAKLTEQPAYSLLQQHYQHLSQQQMRDWFVAEDNRFQQFSLQVGELFLDYSKNRVTTETMSLLSQLAMACELPQKIENLFLGAHVNTTENRPALHTALRDQTNAVLTVSNKNILQDVQDTLAHMQQFVAAVRNQEWKGVTGKVITTIVNIGVGGSHLGPMMTIQALKAFTLPTLNCHFISNIDETQIHEVLEQIDPETTLFIVSSKSFTTLESISNAKMIYAWMQNFLGKNVAPHFVAVTAEPNRAIAFGIPEKQIFNLWEWVGGRYSIWSAIGLPLALMIGMENFKQFLAGAHAMDQHFRQADYAHNMPVIMALLGVWYINFFNASQHAIVPYTHALHFLPEYIQQLDMESNGKNHNLSGDSVDYLTGPIIFGKQGCDSQHSYFQALHQGQHLVPVDFILTAEQDMLVASALSQAQALMQGKTVSQNMTELLAAGMAEASAKALAQHKTILGNHPSNMLFLNSISPSSLGSLIALYEHKTYVQSVIWNINPFDQWGVELGKQLLTPVIEDLLQDPTDAKYDSSTLGLIRHYKKLRNQH